MGPLRKLDRRSKSYQFVDYAPCGYRLWNSAKRSIVIARDVRFKTAREFKDQFLKKEIKTVKMLKEENEDTEETSENNSINEEEEDIFEDAQDPEEIHEDEEEVSSEDGKETERRKSSRQERPPEKYKDFVYVQRSCHWRWKK